MATNDFDQKAAELDPEAKYKTPNTIINTAEKEFVRIVIIVPPLKVKRQMNFSKLPKNGRLTSVEYNKKTVLLIMVVNEGSADEQTYRYKSKVPFQGEIEEEKSVIKFKDGKLVWMVHKVGNWSD